MNLFSLALPMLFEHVVNNLLGFVSSAFLSGYSQTAVAAVGSASSVISAVSVVLTVLANGAAVTVSNYIGANDPDGASKSCRAALTSGMAAGALLSLISALFAGEIMGLMNLEADALVMATAYFRIRMSFFFIQVVSGVLSAMLRCFGYPGPTVFSGLLTVSVNLLLSVWVIKFPDHCPLTGIDGIAAACVVSQLAGLVSNLIFTRLRRVRYPRPRSLGEYFTFVRRVLRIGIPTGLTGMAYSVSQTVTTSFIGVIGTFAVSAKVYYSNILMWAYLFSVCFGTANSYLVGRLAGAGDYDRADALNRRLARLTRAVNLSLSVIIILLRRPLLGIFTGDERILSTCLAVFIVDAVAEQARATSQVYEYALRGAGDMKFMMAVVTLSCWILGVGLSWVLAIPAGMGILGCWIGMASDECVRAVASYFRWKSGIWRSADPTR